MNPKVFDANITLKTNHGQGRLVDIDFDDNFIENGIEWCCATYLVLDEVDLSETTSENYDADLESNEFVGYWKTSFLQTLVEQG